MPMKTLNISLMKTFLFYADEISYDENISQKIHPENTNENENTSQKIHMNMPLKISLRNII